MSKVCQVTGKMPQSGNNVSHANNRVKRKFFPNLHTHRFWVETENRFVSLKLSTKGMRIIDKKGIDEVLKEIRDDEYYILIKNFIKDYREFREKNIKKILN